MKNLSCEGYGYFLGQHIGPQVFLNQHGPLKLKLLLSNKMWIEVALDNLKLCVNIFHWEQKISTPHLRWLPTVVTLEG